MFTKKYTKEFSHFARTLPADCIGNNKSGWIIEGEIHEDYYLWVNEFKAFHPNYGYVEGDFETAVKATSEKTLNKFLEDHPFEEWDYYDI